MTSFVELIFPVESLEFVHGRYLSYNIDEQETKSTSLFVGQWIMNFLKGLANAI